MSRKRQSLSAVSLDADALERLALRVSILRPSRHDPEAFHVERDAIAKDLALLARRLRLGPPPASPTTSWRSP